MSQLELSRSDSEIIALFQNLKNRQDIANILEITDDQLKQHLYRTRPRFRYTYFTINKRSGKKRTIMAPITPLKIIQRKLNYILQLVYKAKPVVHGFTKDKSIVTNANVHLGSRLILNIDLKDFFPSINFGRVRGMFIGKPYQLNTEVATCLAQIICHNNQLPQGAPTSPVVSNMICAQMDSQLQRLARKYGCPYTRYADDMTFSTHESRFPKQIASFVEDTQQAQIGSELVNIITSNGFTINEDKIRMQAPHRRQEVTGLIVNEKVNVDRKYIRQIRAMLHALRKYGPEAAAKEYYQKYRRSELSPYKKPHSFERILLGKLLFLGMVRGREDPLFIKLWNQLAGITATINIQPIIALSSSSISRTVKIHTEGKTDWMHLKAAFVKLKSIGKLKDLEIEFDEYDDSKKMGDDALKSFCKNTARSPNIIPHIFIFDNDKAEIVKEMSENESFKNWGNNTFSFVIPIPNHRNLLADVCIEMYYTDEEIQTRDSTNRRLYLSNEFHPVSGKHISIPDLNSLDMNKIKNQSRATIIDDKVYNSSHNNVALTKSKFAQYVLAGEGEFAKFDPTPFEHIFLIIEQIAHDQA